MLMIPDAADRSGIATVVGGVTGIIAPIIFVMLVVVQGLQHSDYSHTELPISALAAWPHGWVQSLNFLVLGTGVLAFALALHRAVVSDRSGVTAPVLLAASGIGLLLAAVFPWQRVDQTFVVPSGHVVGAVLTFVGAGTGLVVISRRMARDLRWRSMSAYVLVSGLAVLGILVVTMSLARSDGAPLHAWLGVLQRLMLLAWLPCMVALSWRTMRTTAYGDRRGEPDRVAHSQESQ